MMNCRLCGEYFDPRAAKVLELDISCNADLVNMLRTTKTPGIVCPCCNEPLILMVGVGS